jgi:hypothetical protein
MNPNSESQPNPIHQSDTSFRGERVVITDDPGLPLDSPEALERDRKRREQLAEAERRRANGETSS